MLKWSGTNCRPLLTGAPPAAMKETLLPLFPLDLVLLPEAPLPLHIFEERYKTMIGECIDNRKEFGVVLSRKEGIERVGCTAQVST